MPSPISDMQVPTSAYPRYYGPEKSSPVPGTIPGTSPSISPPYQVSLSNDARNLAATANGSPPEETGSSQDAKGTVAPGECESCSNRKYVDVSNDASVSFQTPTKLSPGNAESMVRAHEQEHVTNEQVRAEEQGARVVAQNVSIRYSICTECGRSYVAGGTTTTVVKSGGDAGRNASGSFSVMA